MINLLIVEDHGIVRDSLSDLFAQQQDLQVAGSAASATEAIEVLRSGVKPDVMLIDLHLGETCGIELAQQALQMLPEMKTMILTMDADERYLAKAFRIGVKGYVLKETGCDELLYGIRKVCQDKHFMCTALTSRLSTRLASKRYAEQQLQTNLELSDRETEILHLLADGHTNLEIADRLFTSRRTVEGHRQSLLNKAGVRNTPELIKFAMLHGLLNLTNAI